MIGAVLPYAVTVVAGVLLAAGAFNLSDGYGSIVVVLILMAIAVGVTFKITSIASNDSQRSEDGDEHIALSDLSKIWMPKAGSCVPAMPMVTVAAVFKAEHEQTKYVIQSPELKKFYEEIIAAKDSGFAYEPEVLNLVMEIMVLLDKYGQCPSVVEMAAGSGQREFNNDLKHYQVAPGKSIWSVLKQVTLLEHSIGVARLAFRKAPQPDSRPTMVAAAFAHDLGKIPEFRKDPLFALGSHPAIGMLILKQKTSFHKLLSSIQVDIERAVMDHHLRQSDRLTPCAVALQQSDDEARMKEVMAMTTESEWKNMQGPDGYFAATAGPPAIEKSRPEEETKGKPTKPKAERFDVSWLDLGKLIGMLKPYINIVEGGIFNAVSMRNATKSATVFMNVNLMREKANACAEEFIAKANIRIEKTAEGDKTRAELEQQRNQALQFLAGEISQQNRNSKSLAVTNRLRAEGLIDDSLIVPGYYGGYYIVRYKDGHTLDDYFAVPIRAEAFGDIDELEKRKAVPIVANITLIEINAKKSKKPKKEKSSEAA